jgi:hypothetical protein
MKIKAQIKRTCKHNGSTYEDVELSEEEVEIMLIKKCDSLYSDNTGCTFNVEGKLNLEVE